VKKIFANHCLDGCGDIGVLVLNVGSLSLCARLPLLKTQWRYVWFNGIEHVGL